MYARQVATESGPNSRPGFARKIGSGVPPLAGKQKEFQDEISFIDRAGKDAFAINLWDSKASAAACNRATFAEVTELLSEPAEGIPQLKSFEVPNSAFHNIAVTHKAASWYRALLFAGEDCFACDFPTPGPRIS